jgi:hypothetical protein
MHIIEHNNYNNIVVEFQDKWKSKVHTTYGHFLDGRVKNPYYPSVLGIGMVGIKYPFKSNTKVIEYNIWKNMLNRCFNKKYKEKQPTYENCTICDEWLIYENFYDWLHSQENFDKWTNKDSKFALDKDILVKGNKIYSPETCCLVPKNVNSLFTKREVGRGCLPIGVGENGHRFKAACNNPYTGKYESLGTYDTPKEAFLVYKKYKENLIKQIAKEEYDNGNINKKCYESMMNYTVEITD